MPRLDHIPDNASPVSVTQAGLIRLNGPARAIALDVLRVNSLQTGAYVSHFKGRGMEFDESRPYQPGDDPRSIDWRVTARSTTAYTKLFREERERPVLVMVDLRASSTSQRRVVSSQSTPAALPHCCPGLRITAVIVSADSSSATRPTAKSNHGWVARRHCASCINWLSIRTGRRRSASTAKTASRS